MSARRLLVCLALVFCASCAPESAPSPAAAPAMDNAEIRRIAKAKATECQEAFTKGEYETFVNLTHPKIVERAGGRKKMIDIIAAEVNRMKAQGTDFKSVEVSDPSEPITADHELYITVPFTIVMNTRAGPASGKSALVGLSSDGGKNWTFIDARAY